MVIVLQVAAKAVCACRLFAASGTILYGFPCRIPSGHGQQLQQRERAPRGTGAVPVLCQWLSTVTVGHQVLLSGSAGQPA